jgi:hypothetical protein
LKQRVVRPKEAKTDARRLTSAVQAGSVPTNLARKVERLFSEPDASFDQLTHAHAPRDNRGQTSPRHILYLRSGSIEFDPKSASHTATEAAVVH